MDLQGVFVKIGILLKGFLVEFLENRRSWEDQKPQKIARKVDFLSLDFYNAPSLQNVEFWVQERVKMGQHPLLYPSFGEGLFFRKVQFLEMPENLEM